MQQSRNDSGKASTTTDSSSNDTKCPSPPFVTVEGVPNFRDLGGKTCTPILSTNSDPSSRTLRPGYIYRCAQPTHITANGYHTLTSTLEITDIFDLRSFKELKLMEKRYPDRPLDIEGVRRHHVPVFKDEDYTPISLANKYSITTDSTDAGEKYVSAYADILSQGAASGAFRAILQHILNHPDRPLAFHCTAGKDRTGVLAALSLSLCGVNNEEIVQDYAYTTHGLGKWRGHLIRRLMEGAGEDYRNQGEGGRSGDERQPPTREEAERIVASRPEQMEGFLELLGTEFGGARKYLREQCGFEDGELDRVVENLMVEAR